jgi:beta-fructofuranosidase
MTPFYNCSGFNFNDFDLLVEGDTLYAMYVKKIPFPKEEHDSKPPNRYGLAKTNDGVTWEEVGDIIMPGQEGSWDESLWAGGISEQEDRYVIYYTAVKRLERQPSCKIGKAYSEDLIHWEKDTSNPVFTFDPTNLYYSDEPKLSFRDPFFFQYEGKKYLLFCAKDKSMEGGRRGCVGMVEEVEPNHFKWMPPLFSPGIYEDGLECPALYEIEGRWYLLYGIDGAFRYAVADSPFGPFVSFQNDQLFSTNNYVSRIVRFRGKLLLYHWYRDYPEGLVRERLAPAKEVHILKDGQVSLSDLED